MTSTPIHTLVYIGAGHGSQLPQYKSMPPARLVLIEPLPTHANSLRHIYPNAEVWELAISCQHNNQPATFVEFNLSEASSLHQPSGLLQLYPGIKIVRQHQVQTQTPAAMMTTLNLPENETHHLLVEANGEEAAIVLELAQLGLLQQFKQVQVALHTTPLYNSELHAEQLPQPLQACHFELAEQNTDDPDTHIQVWRFNELSSQLAQQRDTLFAQINEQAQQITQLTTKLQQEQTKHTAASRHADALKSQLAELKTQNTEASKQLADLQQSFSEAEGLQLQKQKEIAALKASVENYQQVQQSTQNKLTALEQALAEKQALLATSEEELTKYKSYFQNRKKQHEAAQQQITELTQQLSNANEQISQLKAQLQQQQQASNQLSALEQKMEQLFAGQAEQLRQNTNALGQHVTKTLYNSTRQLVALMGVQQNLQYGEAPLSYNGWAIGADLALHLVQKVQQHNYDIVIEFGSGTSTLLLAKALLNKSINIPLQRSALEHKRNGTVLGEYIEPNEQDLPQRIISFEHDKRYYKQTLQNLQQQGLAQMVELIHAPLVDYSEQGSDYLFYDCKGKIKQLAQTLAGREAHILVLVDGPSSTQEQENARYPALPYLLKHLAAHKLDIILDDYHRGGEQQIAEQWRSQLKARSLHFTEAILPCEKGALALEINH